MSFEGKVALVTGASRGIGKAIAQTLANEGARVVGTATSEQGASNIGEYLSQCEVAGRGIMLDITQPESIENLLTVISDEWEAPAILVNNAGITRDNLLLRMDDDEWDTIIDTNLSSVYRLSKAVIKTMFRARFGRIINISSVVAAIGNSGQANYAAAKAGMIGFTKSLAQEVARRGITVNAVSPGFIDTDMTAKLPDMVREEMLKRIPMKSLGDAQDVANAVAFLASDRAKYITGETIHVNGGMYMA